MSCVPPYDLLSEWLDVRPRDEGGRMIMPYEDVVDLLEAFVGAIPVDEGWYLTEYPPVADLVRSIPAETAASHFRMHGYLEGRRPFAAGWNGYAQPIAFDRLKPLLRLVPTRGGLTARMFREEFLELIKQLLRAAPVDTTWYSAYYPIPEMGFTESNIGTIATHFAETGYFNGWLPSDIEVDAEWYQRRYEHVQRALEAGHAADAKDHFLKMGYREGCRPIPP
jgi:hypothetical protein